MNEFEIVRALDEGKRSLIFEVKRGTRHYALKVLKMETCEEVRAAVNEVAILQRITRCNGTPSRFLPTLYRSFVHNDCAHLVITMASGLDLHELRIRHGRMNERQMRFYASEVICGLEHLHALGIVHMDIKASNILLKSDGHVMIADFDWSYDTSVPSRVPKREDFGGTYVYLAPESAQMDSITLKTDIWNLGMLMAWLVVGDLRWNPGDDQTFRKIIMYGAWVVPKCARVSSLFRSLLHSCLHRDPDERPSIRGIKTFPFFAGVDWHRAARQQYEPPIKVESCCKVPSNQLPARDKYGKFIGSREGISQSILFSEEYKQKLVATLDFTRPSFASEASKGKRSKLLCAIM